LGAATDAMRAPLSKRDARAVVETRADQESGNERIVASGHGADRQKRRFEDDAAAGTLGRETDGHGRAERFSEDHEPLRGKAARPRGVVDRAGVAREPRFGGRALGASVAAIVDEKDVEAEPVVQDLRALQPIRGIAGVAVKEENGTAAFAADPPAEERDSVLGFRREVLGFECVVLRRRREGSRRKVEKRFFEVHTDRDEHRRGDGQKRRAPPVMRSRCHILPPLRGG